MPESQRPRTSPAQASSTSVRSWARNWSGLFSFSGLPVRACRTSMPRVNFPEQTRTKATRSRCAGSMFAWILKTKPEKKGRRGLDESGRGVARRRGGRQLEEAGEERLDAEVVQGAPEEDGRQLAGEEERRWSNGIPAASSIASSSTRRAWASAPSSPARAGSSRSKVSAASLAALRLAPLVAEELLVPAVVDALEVASPSRWARRRGSRGCRGPSRPRPSGRTGRARPGPAC